MKNEYEELSTYVTASLTVQGDLLQLFRLVHLRIISLLVVSAAEAVGFLRGEV